MQDLPEPEAHRAAVSGRSEWWLVVVVGGASRRSNRDSSRETSRELCLQRENPAIYPGRIPMAAQSAPGRDRECASTGPVAHSRRTYLPTYLPTYIPTYLPTYQPTYLPTYLPTNLPTYQPTNLPPTTTYYDLLLPTTT